MRIILAIFICKRTAAIYKTYQRLRQIISRLLVKLSGSENNSKRISEAAGT